MTTARGLTLDTGALVALERKDARVLGLIGAAQRDGVRIVVPAPVLAEWWRGQKGPVARLRDAFSVDPVDKLLCLRAGVALAEVGKGPSAVDAIVMASAASRGDRVLTSDVEDLTCLSPAFPEVRVLGVGSKKR